MLPAQRTSKRRTRTRRAHQALEAVHYVRCRSCGSAKRPHAACGNCGFVRPGLAVRLDPLEGESRE